MQSLEEFFVELGLVVSAPTLNGLVHRVDHNEKPGDKSGWYVGWEVPYRMVVAGDWRTGLKREWKAHQKAKLSREERKHIDKQVAEARQRSEWERLERQRLVAIEARQILSTSTPAPADHPYLVKKKVGTHGLRHGEGALLIPMADEAGNIHGLQRILEDGQKLFLPGQRVSGCAFRIGGDDQRVILCEGFATGASLAEATGATVFVAFNAGNLSDVMAWVRHKYPTAILTVCGDEDQWTQGNPGRQKATAAAELGQCAAVFPVFEDLDGKPTDFNDLHCREGLDAVREQVQAPGAAKKKMAPLGRIGQNCFVYDYASRDIIVFTNFANSQFLHLAPLAHWQHRYPKESKETTVDWDAAKDEIIQFCKKAGTYDPSRVRGSGVWLSSPSILNSKTRCFMNADVIVNTGPKVFRNGSEVDITQLPSRHVYTRGKPLPTPVGEAATTAEAEALVAACQALNWRDPEMGSYLAGWLAIAPLAGALPVRPHAWLTGPSGGGKSTILNGIVKAILPTYAAFQGETTSAGIRQSVGNSSIPVVFDEFEPNASQASQLRIESIVELLRQAWSPTDGGVTKGSTEGTAVPYHPTFPAMVSSIKVFLTNEADQSRFVILELNQHGSREDQWQMIRALLAKLDRELALKIWRRMVRIFPIILENYEIIRGVMVAAGRTQRWSSQHGIILAGFHGLVSNEVISAPAAESLVTDTRHEPVVLEHHELMNKILTSKVRYENGSGSFSIGYAIFEPNIEQDGVISPKTRLAVLRSNGIVLKDQKIIISNNHAALGHMLSRTKWHGSWFSILKRFPGATTIKSQRFDDHVSQAVSIPLSELTTA